MHSHTAIQPGARLAGWKFENHGWDFTVGSTVGARLGSAGNLRLGCRLGPVGGSVGISRLGPSVGPGWDGWPVGPAGICPLAPNREIPAEPQPNPNRKASREHVSDDMFHPTAKTSTCLTRYSWDVDPCNSGKRKELFDGGLGRHDLPIHH